MSKVDGKFPFNPISVNFLAEICKILFSLVMLIIQGRNGRGSKSLIKSLRMISKVMRANYLLVVPACLYAINNYLKFAMQLYFKPLTVKMLGNLKVLVIAVLLKLVMGRKFSILQWEALMLLLLGISINQVPCGAHSFNFLNTVDNLAWVYIFLSITIPSTASVFNEYALKQQFETNVHLQNLIMFFYGATFNFLLLFGLQIFQGGDNWNLLKGHSRSTLILIVNNAFQGILSSFFFKYADTILKKYSSSVATIFTGLASFVLFGHVLTINFILGISVVLISMHQFFSDQPSKAKRRENGEVFPRGESLLNMASGANEEANHSRIQSGRQSLLP